MAELIDFATIESRELYEQVRFEENTFEDDLEQKERDPGHRFAYKYKKEKPSHPGDRQKAAKPNGYMEFVKEMAEQQGRSVKPSDFERYGDEWQALDDEMKGDYKARAKDGKDQSPTEEHDSSEEDSEFSLPAFNNLRGGIDAARRKYGFEGLPECGQIYSFFPPLCDPEPLAGRDKLDDLEMVRGLYLFHAERECASDEKILEEISSRYPVSDLGDIPVHVMHCIPLSRHPDPKKAVSVPVELFLTSFTLKDGVASTGYHSFIQSGDDLYINQEGANVRIGVPYGTTIFTNTEARYEAWQQAHFRYNIPYDGFEVLDRSLPTNPTVDLDRHYDAWDVYFKRTVEKSDEYYEIYCTILELLTNGENGPKPAVFVGLQDADIVEECLEWLRNKAREQAQRSGIPLDILATKLMVLPLEYFLWKIAADLGKPIAEKEIEEALKSKITMELADLRCSFHSRRPEGIICARSTVLLNIYNTFHILLPLCGLEPTVNHQPASEDAERNVDDDTYSDIGSYDGSEDNYSYSTLQEHSCALGGTDSGYSAGSTLRESNTLAAQ